VILRLRETAVLLKDGKAVVRREERERVEDGGGGGGGVPAEGGIAQRFVTPWAVAVLRTT
jgi:hypothetical protein